MQKDDFKQQLELSNDIVKLEQDQQAFKKSRLYEELQEQIRQNEESRKLFKEEDRKPHETNGGPRLPPREEIIEKFKAKQAVNRINL